MPCAASAWAWFRAIDQDMCPGLGQCLQTQSADYMGLRLCGLVRMCSGVDPETNPVVTLQLKRYEDVTSYVGHA
jgi:hypothetical protein